MARRTIRLAVWGLAALLGGWLWSVPAAAQAQGKISRNFYRVPYANDQDTRMLQDYVDHGSTPAGNLGPMDMRDQDGGAPQIVAAAAGTVITVVDNRTECGCDAAYGPCANIVQIQHANGEVSTYLHLAQNSSTNLGITVGTQVAAGTPIGVEGDVGFTCGGESNPRTGACVTSVPAGAGNCFRHLHWDVRRQPANEFVNPMTCGIGGNIYADDTTYDPAACTASGCPTDRDLTGMNLAFNGFGTFRVYQADETVTADGLAVSNQASVVLHAGDSVRLLPGLDVDPGGYFRAEIGACNTTAPAP